MLANDITTDNQVDVWVAHHILSVFCSHDASN